MEQDMKMTEVKPMEVRERVCNGFPETEPDSD